ncbi:hypothetical protein DEU56DRAFT_910377 [Suillus clintonianus]|uniref:uncharacterized protein n=1 Tax=Suillus clintonianus TaxID=1904413 RepID=UPI001B8754D4|nr:uncharacterized protein DEU56DRAFT_910377 [Suillus clintonianus]KAG2145257.1 hypothetical protein DEU56DRAFT_910377 [Suillus clintonianus]
MDSTLDPLPQPIRPARQDKWEYDPDVTNLNSPPRPRAPSKCPLPPPSPSPPPPSEFAPPKSYKLATMIAVRPSQHLSRRNVGACATLVGPPAHCGQHRINNICPFVHVPNIPTCTILFEGQRPPSQEAALRPPKPGSKPNGGANWIESAQSDRVVHKELKNKHYMVKFNFARQTEEHHFLHEERAYERTEANVIHQGAQEMKDSEICLCEAETKMHDTLAHAHAEEAATLHLKIEYCRLSQGS